MMPGLHCSANQPSLVPSHSLGAMSLLCLGSIPVAGLSWAQGGLCPLLSSVAWAQCSLLVAWKVTSALWLLVVLLMVLCPLPFDLERTSTLWVRVVLLVGVLCWQGL